MGKSKPKRTFLQSLKEWRRALIIAIVLVAVVKAFFFDLCVVSSTSMEKSLLTGDFVIINKIAYGPRTPITPLTVPMTHQTLPVLGTSSYSTIMQLPYWRLPGYSSIENGDIVVFNYPLDATHPVDHRTYYIKRCIALPGETVELQMAQVTVNGEAQAKPTLGQQNYRVEIDESTFTREILERYNITEGGPTHHKNTLELSLTDTALNGRINELSVLEIVALYHPPGMADALTYPFVDSLPWNRDNFGPIRVPAAGDTVAINTASLPLYERIIEDYEGHQLEVDEGSIYIDGALATSYVFDFNYYFLMGDNRHQSADSRSWGFVPENHIVGRASGVLFSMDNANGGLRWGRTFKGLSE